MPKLSTTNTSRLLTQVQFLEPSFYSVDVLAMLVLGNLKILQPMVLSCPQEGVVVDLDASSRDLTTKQLSSGGETRKVFGGPSILSDRRRLLLLHRGLPKSPGPKPEGAITRLQVNHH